MSTFLGNIEVRADDKGRIFVPATYRRILAEMGSKRLVIRRDTDNECLIFYPEQVWNEKVSGLRAVLDEWDPEDEMLLMQFMSEADFLETDAQGRVLLNKQNMSLVGGKDLVFVGMYDRFALWSASTFEEHKVNPSDLAAAIRSKIATRKNNG